MVSLFDKGKRTGSKVDPFDAAKAMQREKNDGEYVFTSTEYLQDNRLLPSFHV